MICQDEIQNLPSKKLENRTENEERDFTRKTKTGCEWKAFKDITRKKKISGIYKIINKVNGKYYVGRAKNVFKNRLIHHKSRLNKYTHDNDYLQRSWNKYGESNFELVIVEETTHDKLVETEQKYLDIAKTERDKCYNCNFLADGQTWEPQSREKKRQSMLGEKNFFYGRKHTKESKILMSLTHIGLKHPNRKRPPKFSKEHLKNIQISRNKWIKQSIPKHNFFNVITKEEFVGTVKDFHQKFNLKMWSVRRLVNHKKKIYENWIIVKPSLAGA